MYDVALFVHLLGVGLLIAAVTTGLQATLRAQTARSVGEVASLMGVTKKIDLVIGPSMLLILAPGLYMVGTGGGDGSIRWSSGWVDVSIVVFAVMSVLGPTVESGHAKRVLTLATQLPDGPVTPDLDAVRRAPAVVVVSFFGMSQVVAFLFLMSNKPSLPGALAACIVAAAVSAVASAARLRSLQRRAAVVATPVPTA